MAYRRPGVEVIQDFQNLSPALALPTLPNLVVGPAYQIMADADVGQYNDVDGTVVTAQTFPYTGLAPGAIVDVADLETFDQPSVQKPIGVTLENAYLVELSGTAGTTGSSAPITQFNDSTSNQFAAINPGAVGAPLFYLQIISGTGVNPSDLPLNLIVAKNTVNQIVLAREVSANMSAVVYRVLSFHASEVIAPSQFAALGITKSVNNVSLPATLTISTTDTRKVAIAEVHLSWRALRPDLADVITTVSPVPSGLAALEAVFGVGEVVPPNILAYGMLCAMNNTTTPVNGLGLTATFLTDENAAYLEALDFAGDKDVYAIAICSQQPVDHQTLSSNVTAESDPTVGRERIGFINRQLLTFSVITPGSGIGTQTGGVTSAPNNTIFRDTSTPATFITNGVHVGDFLEISAYTAVPGIIRTITHQAGDNVDGGTRTWTFANGAFTQADVGRELIVAGAANSGNNATHLIQTVSSATVVITTSATAPVTETFGGGVTANITQATLTAAQDAFIKGTRFFIASVNSETQVTLQIDPTSGFPGTVTGVTYRVTRNMTLDQQAAFLAGYSTSFANRRLYNVWPDIVFAPVNGVDTALPGYFACCALVGFISGLPSQQGLTNLAIAGFDGREHGKDYFSDTELDTIAGGGTLILEQDVAQAPLFVRHQLSTDMSSVQFRELSVTKNVDLIARFFRGLVSPYIGPWNVTTALLDHLKTVTTGGISFLKNSSAPRAGSILIDGSIVSLVVDPNEGDQVDETVDITIPLPFNYLQLTLVI